jgi:hypothetical protein
MCVCMCVCVCGGGLEMYEGVYGRVIRLVRNWHMARNKSERVRVSESERCDEEDSTERGSPG